MLSQVILLLIGIQRLEQECDEFRYQQFAVSTRATHRIQVQSYFDFCREFDLKSSNRTHHICLYITFLARRMSFSSIRQYVSAINGWFISLGWSGIDYEAVEYKACLNGIRRSIGDRVFQAVPLMPVDMLKMFNSMQSDSVSVVVRAAMLVSFRALLRVGHVTNGSNVLKRNNFQFFDWGMKIVITKSKTIQYKERELVIPIRTLRDSELCAVCWVKRHFKQIPANVRDAAFRVKTKSGSIAMSYQIYLGKLKELTRRAGFQESSFTTQSVRRGGATFLVRCGLSVRQIGECGDWCSTAIEKYLGISFRDRMLVDEKMASLMNNLV